jgi:hypothetical protein
MPYRTFIDYAGTSWHVWDVVPSQAERRYHERRLMHVLTEDAEDAERRAVEDRRRQAGIRAQLPPELVNGWLVFDCRSLKRRYWPIPDGWENLSVGELSELCELAVPVQPYPADLATLSEMGTPNPKAPRT